MASIQQSLNQTLGALAGAATAGAYMYRQTPHYQARVSANEAENLLKVSKEATADNLEEAEIVAEEAATRARKAYTLNPSAKHQNLYFDTLSNLEDYQQRYAEVRGVRRLGDQITSKTSLITGFEQRKEALSRKGEPGWADNLTAALDAPGDTSRDRLKLATITRDIRYKEKHKGETE